MDSDSSAAPANTIDKIANDNDNLFRSVILTWVQTTSRSNSRVELQETWHNGESRLAIGATCPHWEQLQVSPAPQITAANDWP